MTIHRPLGADALRDLLRQTATSGARRCAVLLHADRLPPFLAKPHHLRLAREALHSLTEADRAQMFELSQGRIAIVWRKRGGGELEQAKAALSHLLSGQPNGQTPSLGDLLTQYDLPGQAVALLDEMAEPLRTHRAHAPDARALDLKALARLESLLNQADLARFMRWRGVMRLPEVWPPSRHGRAEIPAGPELAWEERYFAVYDLTASICPDRDLKAEPWLFRRLTRTLDHRMLAIMSGLRDDHGSGAFAININVSTILSAEFLRFDDALHPNMRGRVALNLRADDILADPSAYAFARNFTRARGYALRLAGATINLLKFLDVGAMGLDGVQVALRPDILAAPEALRRLVPAPVELVVMSINRPSDIGWAHQHGFRLAAGEAFSR
jgi:hypothetical protein